MDEDIDELLDYGEDNIHIKDKEENSKNNIMNHNDNQNDKLYYFEDVEIDTKKNDTKPKTDNDLNDLLDSDDEKKKFDNLLDSNEPVKKDFGLYFNSKKQKSSIFDDLDNEKEMNEENNFQNENIDDISINDKNNDINKKKEEDNKLNDSNEVIDEIHYENNNKNDNEYVNLIDTNENDNKLNKSNEVVDEFNYDNNDNDKDNQNENNNLNQNEDDNIFNNSNDNISNKSNNNILNNSNDNISNKSNENKEKNENNIEDNNNKDDYENEYNDFEDDGTFITGTNVVKNNKNEKVETGIDTNEETISKKNLSKNPSLASTIKKKNNTSNNNYYKSNYSINKQTLNTNTKSLSNYDKAEMLYLKIKNDINNILESNITNEFDISRENAKMFSIFNQLNNITNLITDGTKLNIKSKYNNNNYSIKENEQISDPSINNEKIINRYENEYNKLQNKMKKFKNPELEEKLEIEKRKITNDIMYYEKENHTLKQLQKINDYRFERQLKNPNTRQTQLKRFENDYEKLKKDYDKVVNNIEKNKQRQKDYETKLEELKNFKKRIEELAKDMYNITEFKKIGNTEKEEKEKKKNKENLEKKFQILENSFGTNKARYENAISKKEKIIFEKEKEKLDLLKDLKMESSKNEKLKDKINEMYEPIVQMQKEELKAKEEEKKVREILKKQNEIEQEKMRLLQEENYRRLQEERNNNIKKEEKKVFIQNNNLNNYNNDLNNKIIQNDNFNYNNNNNYYNKYNYENKKPIDNINQNINNYNNRKPIQNINNNNYENKKPINQINNYDINKPIENINKSPILNDKKEYILINKNKKEESPFQNELNKNNIIERKGVLPPVQIGKGRKPNFNFKLNDLIKNENKENPILIINKEKNISNQSNNIEKEKQKEKKFEEIKEENENEIEIENKINNNEINEGIQNKNDEIKIEEKKEDNFNIENKINNDNIKEKEENNLKDLELEDNKNIEMFLEKEELPTNTIKKNYQEEKIENPKIEKEKEKEKEENDNFYIEKEEKDEKNLIEQPIKKINKKQKEKNNEDNILNTSGISSIKNEGNNIEDETLNKKLSEHNFSKENIEYEKEEDEFTKMFKRRMNQEEVIQKEGPLIRDKVKEDAFNALLKDDNAFDYKKNNKKETKKSPIDDFDNLEDFIL